VQAVLKPETGAFRVFSGLVADWLMRRTAFTRSFQRGRLLCPCMTAALLAVDCKQVSAAAKTNIVSNIVFPNREPVANRGQD
jgi:hypothetical protein